MHKTALTTLLRPRHGQNHSDQGRLQFNSTAAGKKQDLLIFWIVSLKVVHSAIISLYITLDTSLFKKQHVSLYVTVCITKHSEVHLSAGNMQWFHSFTLFTCLLHRYESECETSVKCFIQSSRFLLFFWFFFFSSFIIFFHHPVLSKILSASFFQYEHHCSLNCAELRRYHPLLLSLASLCRECARKRWISTLCDVTKGAVTSPATISLPHFKTACSYPLLLNRRFCKALDASLLLPVAGSIISGLSSSHWLFIVSLCHCVSQSPSYLLLLFPVFNRPRVLLDNMQMALLSTGLGWKEETVAVVPSRCFGFRLCVIQWPHRPSQGSFLSPLTERKACGQDVALSRARKWRPLPRRGKSVVAAHLPHPPKKERS